MKIQANNKHLPYIRISLSLAFLFSFYSSYGQYPSGSPVAINGKLKVIGSKLRNECGNPVQLRGMSSHGMQWFGHCINNSSIEALAKDWQADILRIAMYNFEGGYVNDREHFKRRIDEIVEQCGIRGIYVIIDFHVHIPGDPMEYLSDAREFWTYMSAKHANKKHVLYEICNEPNNVPWVRVKEYANIIIPLIRKSDPTTTIIVGTSTYSQNVDSAAYDPLPYPNLIYALHFYTQGERLRRKGSIALAKGLPIIVSEFGTSNAANTQGPFYDEMEIWNAWLRDKEVSWCNWSFSDKAEPSSALTPGSCYGNWNSTTASGTWVKNKIKTPADKFVCNGDTGKQVKASTTPYKGTPWPIPGKIEAEDYDVGGQGIAYRDFTNGNHGTSNLYRSDDVDLIECNDSGLGYAVDTITAGEWLNYTVNVAEDGFYDFRIRIASKVSNQHMHITMNGKNVTGLVTVLHTGSSTLWRTVNVEKVYLKSGIQDMQIHFDGSGFRYNYVKIDPSTTVGLLSEQDKTLENGTIISPNPSREGFYITFTNAAHASVSVTVFNTTGELMHAGKAALGETTEIGNDWPSGVYTMRVASGQNVMIKRLVKL